MPYTPFQMFDLVADVERYPEFLPWVIESCIRARTDQTVLLDMTIGTGPLRKRISTAGVLHRPHRIDVGSSDPLFERFAQRWTFEPMARGGTNVGYHIELRFRSRALKILTAMSFADRSAAMIAAFIQRADRLYGGRS